MQHAVLVREGQGARHGVDHVGALGGRETAPLHAGEQLGEVEPVDVLHHEIGKRAVRLKVEHRDDVWVAEHAGGAGLGERLGRRGARLGEQRHALDRHAPLQAQVPAGADGPKAARSAAREHAVSAEKDLVGRAPARATDARARCAWRVAHGSSLVLAACGRVGSFYPEKALGRSRGMR